MYWLLRTVETFQFVRTPPVTWHLEHLFEIKINNCRTVLNLHVYFFICWTCEFCQLTRVFCSRFTHVYVFSLHVYEILIRLQLLSSYYACFLLVAVCFETLLWYLSLIICQGPKYRHLLSVFPRCWIYLTFKLVIAIPCQYLLLLKPTRSRI